MRKTEKRLSDKIIKLESKLLIEQSGAKKNKVSWELFRLPYAFYIIKIGCVYKAGAVGLHSKSLDVERLDNRLSTHRSTYAKFELITVINFINASTVKLFEKLIKLCLGIHCIGRGAKIEQYEFEEGIGIKDLVYKEFCSMNIEKQNLGCICPNDQIDRYNSKVRHNLS